MTRLEIGATHSLTVDPRPLFVPSGLEVAPGERYRFVASGKWKDWRRVVDANGWKLWSLQHWNRVSGASFFSLCGCVGNDDRNAFAIGAELEWPVPDLVAGLPGRELNLFANDWPGMYWNNHALPPPDGPLRVAITRIA
ncbi:hypothetical protein [Sulfuritalea sp.]|uniref:hypothetical protein n=1 Tax=Sulfuritalea sp. TaxID=2480090 RepID=UPI00286E6E5D|nr:hypothetical protein [Sulfuritalea sp.]